MILKLPRRKLRSIASYIGTIFGVTWLSFFIVTHSEVFSRYAKSNYISLTKGMSKFIGYKGSECTCPYPSKGGSLVTLFTTSKDLPDRSRGLSSTLANWASLKPWVTPLLYVKVGDDPVLASQAVSLGWTVRRVPRLSGDLPVLKDMFLDAAALEERTPFYGYADSDGLFDVSLTETLRCLLHANLNRSRLLVVGRRTNIRAASITGDVADPNYLRSLAKTGEIFVDNAQEYLITSADGFPWPHVPDFVVGRVGFENWLVAKALEWNITLIDATETLRNFYQTENSANQDGWNNADACVNRDLIGEFDFSRGRTSCATWETRRRSPPCQNVRLLRRLRGEVPPSCDTASRLGYPVACAAMRDMIMKIMPV